MIWKKKCEILFCKPYCTALEICFDVFRVLKVVFFLFLLLFYSCFFPSKHVKHLELPCYLVCLKIKLPCQKSKILIRETIFVLINLQFIKRSWTFNYHKKAKTEKNKILFQTTLHENEKAILKSLLCCLKDKNRNSHLQVAELFKRSDGETSLSFQTEPAMV